MNLIGVEEAMKSLKLINSIYKSSEKETRLILKKSKTWENQEKNF